MRHSDCCSNGVPHANPRVYMRPVIQQLFGKLPASGAKQTQPHREAGASSSLPLAILPVAICHQLISLQPAFTSYNSEASTSDNFLKGRTMERRAFLQTSAAAAAIHWAARESLAALADKPAKRVGLIGTGRYGQSRFAASDPSCSC